MWKRTCLDVVIVMTYAPGQSKYNPIERQWAPRSRDLSGLILSACVPGEDKPPTQQANLTEEQKTQKQKAVHREAIVQLCSIWNQRTYDGYKVTALAIPNPEEDESAELEEEQIDDLASAGVRRLRDDPTCNPW